MKDNSHLAFGFLTGILRVAKESIFSGLNNLAVHSILDQNYSSYFGFTKEEVRQCATAYVLKNKVFRIMSGELASMDAELDHERNI